MQPIKQPILSTAVNKINTMPIDYGEILEEISKYNHYPNDKQVIGAMAVNILELKKVIKTLKKQLLEI